MHTRRWVSYISTCFQSAILLNESMKVLKLPMIINVLFRSSSSTLEQGIALIPPSFALILRIGRLEGFVQEKFNTYFIATLLQY